MKKLILGLACLFALAACDDTARYPVSNETCGPDDPVIGLDARDCTVNLPAT